MSDDLPTSIAQSSFKVFGVDLVCHVLSDGRRIIDAASMDALFKAMAEPQTVTVSDHDEMRRAFRWVNEGRKS